GELPEAWDASLTIGASLSRPRFSANAEPWVRFLLPFSIHQCAGRASRFLTLPTLALRQRGLAGFLISWPSAKFAVIAAASVFASLVMPLVAGHDQTALVSVQQVLREP